MVFLAIMSLPFLVVFVAIQQVRTNQAREQAVEAAKAKASAAKKDTVPARADRAQVATYVPGKGIEAVKRVVFVPNVDEPGTEDMYTIKTFAEFIAVENDLQDLAAMEKRLKKVALSNRVYAAAADFGFSEEKWTQMLDEYDREHN